MRFGAGRLGNGQGHVTSSGYGDNSGSSSSWLPPPSMTSDPLTSVPSSYLDDYKFSYKPRQPKYSYLVGKGNSYLDSNKNESVYLPPSLSYESAAAVGLRPQDSDPYSGVSAPAPAPPAPQPRKSDYVSITDKYLGPSRHAMAQAAMAAAREQQAMAQPPVPQGPPVSDYSNLVKKSKSYSNFDSFSRDPLINVRS